MEKYFSSLLMHLLWNIFHARRTDEMFNSFPLLASSNNITVTFPKVATGFSLFSIIMNSWFWCMYSPGIIYIDNKIIPSLDTVCSSENIFNRVTVLFWPQQALKAYLILWYDKVRIVRVLTENLDSKCRGYHYLFALPLNLFFYIYQYY